MSKGLSQMTKFERLAAIRRRLQMSEAVRGLGYWAAKDAERFVKKEEADENND